MTWTLKTNHEDLFHIELIIVILQNNLSRRTKTFDHELMNIYHPQIWICH
jgi:hypothetical protein